MKFHKLVSQGAMNELGTLQDSRELLKFFKPLDHITRLAQPTETTIGHDFRLDGHELSGNT